MASEPFELGLVLAGAVSAGAYSAGVVDFLIEALDEYELTRKTGQTSDGERWDGPTHTVRVPVMAGASAGGMTAAMAALHMFSEFKPLGMEGQAPDAGMNRLYASWVDEIGIRHLLKTSDLDGGRALRSVLCSKVLEEIVERTFKIGRARVRDWVGRDGGLAVISTVSNLSGVPYEFPLAGAAGGEAYGMLNHGDDLCFLVGRGKRDPTPGFDALDLDAPEPTAFGRFASAALATGAFPIGLAARPIVRPYSDYVTNPRVGFERTEPGGSIVFHQIGPKQQIPAGNNAFVAVDGGVVDNEPLELARRYLHGGPRQNPANRDGAKTSYAVLMIDPFPDRPAWPAYVEPPRDKLSDVVLPLLSAMINQARFKPQELALATDTTVFSRHLIAPEPVVQTPASKQLPIACGALGGFSGFLHQSFRRHDYLLGRRNAQAFLRWHLCLPESNALFGAWQDVESRRRWAVRDVREWPRDQYLGPDGDKDLPDKLVLAGSAGAQRSERAFPIIPLTRRLREPIVIGPADRPKPDQLDLEQLNGLLDKRFRKVVERLIDTDLRDYVPAGWLGRQALKMFLPGVATRRAKKAIAEAKTAIEAAFPPGA